MKILLKTAIVLDSSSPFHTKTVDILIEDGKIKEISDKIYSSAELIISKKNLHVSLGWFDSSVCFGEPGLEVRETIQNGLKTASHSGFTDICLQPNTSPRIDNNSILSYLKRHVYEYPCEIHPVACFSIGGKGKNMTEYFDLHKGGAVAFGDFLTPIKNPNLLKSALLYVQPFDGLIISTPRDPYINLNGVVNEGVKSTELGLLSIPTIAETTQIQRDLSILEYTGGKLHIPYISSLESVDIIRNAKKNGLRVSASVPIANLIFNDNVLDGFNSNYKLFPPIRNKEDQKMLARFDIEDLGCGVRDFLDTAEVVSGIDLIITVDTALAHLAGGMGKPVWVMIPHGPDWRWLLEREDSPWYPTARLFRQSKRNNWVSVVERVRKALANHLQNNF